jgi:hypothetical protein
MSAPAMEGSAMRYDLPVNGQGTRVGGDGPRWQPTGPAATAAAGGTRAIPPSRILPAVNIMLAVYVISPVCAILAVGAAVGRRGGTLSAALCGPVGSTAPARAAA